MIRPADALASRPIPRRIALIAALLACAGAAAHAVPGSTEVTLRPAVGVQFHCTWTNQTDAQRGSIVAKFAAAGVRSVRIDFGWPSFEPRRHRRSAWQFRLADRCVNLARANGMQVLGTLLWTPAWANRGRGQSTPPRRAADFARFARRMARHFRGRVTAWEVWNEPNDKSFWTGSARRYARLLRAAYPAIKAGDRNAKVVFAGLMHNDDRFLARAYAGGARGAFDVMGTHPYQGFGDAAPETADDGGDWWLMTHVPAIHNLMARNGDGGKPIWFTEFGWSVHENRPGMENWQRGVTPEEQAAFLGRAVALIRARYPYVERAYWYKDAARPGEDEHQAGYGLLRTDLSPRPAYWALKLALLG